MTKKEKAMVDNYNYYITHYGERSLSDVYQRPSDRKWYAYHAILNEMFKCGGYGLTILGYSSMIFTAAYITHRGIDKYLIYHTAYNRYEIKIS